VRAPSSPATSPTKRPDASCTASTSPCRRCVHLFHANARQDHHSSYDTSPARRASY
jgi:hypothetical protein